MFNSPFSVHDDEFIESEASMQPIPTVVMKGGSVQEIIKATTPRRNRKLTKDTTKKYQTTDFDEIVAEIK